IEYELNPTTDPATASVCGGKPNGNGELNIPSGIQWNDVEYKVISIAPQAFADDAITSVVLPETMLSVGNQAFAQCPNIATVTALSTTPPTMDDDGFAADVYTKAQLKVVGSAVTDYQNAPGWRSFATIRDKDGGLTGIADAATTEAVTIHDGKITAHTTIKVLTLNGLTIATLSEGTTIDTLPAGYYIIVAPGCAIKVRL
ncbi:MAG: leucine-rich repeat domain-containing protein, partial [Muribaculaceae bacterium]|nr:leucine-rich repeat domain-containing protein [Muribaculaceae bacterium]